MRVLLTGAFGVDAAWYFEDWMDTSEAEALLRFQRHTLADYSIRTRTRWPRPRRSTGSSRRRRDRAWIL